MKKVISILAIILAVVLNCAAFAETEITVTGTGTVYVPADTCSITLGVSVKDEYASNAQALVSEKLAAVRDACIQAGISEEAIATGCIQLNTDNSDFVDTETGNAQIYEAYSSIVMNTNDFTIAAAVIDAGIEAGANTVNNVSFSLSDPSVYNDWIFSDACSDAYVKANILAESLGLNISGVKSVNENYTYAADEGHAVVTYENADAAAATVIDGANITVSTTIDITYIAE